MTHRKAFARGVTAGILLMTLTKLAHWYITPAAHPDAGPLQYALAGLLGAGLLGGVLWQARGIPGRPQEEGENTLSPSHAPPLLSRDKFLAQSRTVSGQRKEIPARRRERR